MQMAASSCGAVGGHPIRGLCLKPPPFPSTSIGMKGETEERRWNLAWALPASLILHGLIAAFLVYGLPRPSQQPDQEQPINVALVPPPEQPKPKPQPAPQPKEKPPEQKAEKPPPPEKQPPKPPPIAVLEPVFHYGDKDTGPRKSPDGDGDRDNAPPAKDSDSKTPGVPKPADSQPAGPADLEKPATAAADAKPTQSEEKQATEDADKQQADKQEAGAQIAEKQTAVAPTPLGAESDGKVELPAATEKPKSKLANALKFRPARLSKPRSKSAGGAKFHQCRRVCVADLCGPPGCSKALLARRYRRFAGRELHDRCVSRSAGRQPLRQRFEPGIAGRLLFSQMAAIDSAEGGQCS